MKYVYDIEVYKNHMGVGFMSEDGEIVHQFDTFDSFEDSEISFMKSLIPHLVGFNSRNYDDPIFTFMLTGKNTGHVYRKSKRIIEENIRYWEVYDKLNIRKRFESIDLIDVAPGVASLKLYGARLGSKKLQDLPYDPHTDLTQKQASEVMRYNLNDLKLTLDLYNRIKPMLSLRENIGKKYGINVMSRSDAQIAEAIFKHELTERGVKVKRGEKPKKVVYKAPDAVRFRRKDLNDIVRQITETDIMLGEMGQPLLPKWIKDTTIEIGETTYNIGIGGLHSQEKKLIVRPKEGEILANVDVASYYPSLIIKLGLYPKQLTSTFLKVYSNIKATRLEAKKRKNDPGATKEEKSEAKVIDDVLKITLNGSYGKFGNRYSFLYSPHLMLTVTFTGQLYLLMLIEELEYHGFRVVSSNTDGVEILYDDGRQSKLQRIVRKWERSTGMDMEYGEYCQLFARDVNNYVAIYPEGKVKAKGAYLDPDDAVPILTKNIEYPIVFDAIRDYLSKGTPLEDTVHGCTDVARFTSSRKVKGGAVYYRGDLPNTEEYDNHMEAHGYLKVKAVGKRNDDYQKKVVLGSNESVYLGKVVRWYYSINGKPIFYKSGNKVPKTDGAMPMMDLTDHIPKDLDYDKYLSLCEEHLADLGL